MHDSLPSGLANIVYSKSYTQTLELNDPMLNHPRQNQDDQVPRASHSAASNKEGAAGVSIWIDPNFDL